MNRGTSVTQSVQCLPLARVVMLEFWDRALRWAQQWSPPLPQFSRSLARSVSLK